MRGRVVAVAIAASFAGVALVACGARTSLDAPEEQGGAPGAGGATTHATTASSVASTNVASSSTGPACTSDAECDDGVACTIDFCGADGCGHQGDDAMCGDGLFCTVDLCDPRDGCVNFHADAICDDGIACTSDACDVRDDACHNDPCDSLCDDFAFCDGVERCDTSLGCVNGPPSCDLDLACSADTCSEASKKCTHTMGAACAPDVHLLVADQSGALIDLRPYTGMSSVIAAGAGTIHLDVAILPGPTPRWFGLNSTNVYELVPFTNTFKTIFPGVSANSLAAGPDGFLYAAGTEVFRINPNSGASAVIGTLPPGESSSGDIVFFDGEMIVSTDGPCGGGLARFDLATGTSELLGGDGLGCVFGLGVANGLLFIVNCDGTLGTFDPPSGKARILTTSTVAAYGADAL